MFGRRAFALALVALAGCASGPATRIDTNPVAVPDTPFEVAGRLSARRGNEGVAANFRWMHRPGRDELLLSTPLGQTLARLEGGDGGVRLEVPDGRNREANDWEALTAEILGAPVPVRGLAWWVRGMPHPRAPHSIERDARSRAAVLRQDGWEIVYDYADAGERPLRLRLAYPEVEIRLVLDQWSERPPP